ncbi:MAG: chromosome segregation protein SMC, partial [Oscillospiraceae bacterium]|nr:chromosome segregation protein SMC [Oscillospiraceae bacterium]
GRCGEEITALSNAVDGLSLRLKTRNEKADGLKRTLDEKLFELQHLLSKRKMLEDLEKNMDGYSGSVKAVIKEGKNGTLSGIIGTVSKIISMNSEHTVAIETALGNSVQNIVCESENDAKNAINYLKRNGTGRATFQPVSSVRAKSFEEKGLEKVEGFVSMANELVSYDSKYDEIVRSLLGRIAVCKDIDCAVELAKKYSYHFKVVTLDGQVVNAGGSMTGGSQSRNAGILSRASEIERLSKKHGELQKETEELQKSYDELCISIDKAKDELEKAKGELLSKQEEKIRLEGEKKLSEEQYLTSKAAFDELKTEKENCLERLSSFEEAFSKAGEESRLLSSSIEENEEKLSSLGEKKNELSSQHEKITSELSRLSLDLHDADKDLAARTQAMNLLISRLVSHEDKDRQLDEEIEEIKKKNTELCSLIEELKEKAALLRKDSEKSREKITALQKQRAEKEEQSVKLRTAEREKSAERETVGGEKARLEERRETMLLELDSTVSKLYDEYQLTLREASAENSKTDDPAGAKRRLGEIKNRIRALGSVNVSAIDEYKEVSERYEFMSSQLSDVERSKQELTKLITDLTGKMANRFRDQFALINQYFGETFKELFGGGKAEIVLVDPADVLESDIDIRLQPPGKNVKRLDALSGGEKGLSAIALLFAILKVNPAPFCIFDEVEAALDDANVTRYAQYVRRMTKNTQFILITHRRGTMEEADVLYGITMQEQGVSKLLELKTAELAGKLGVT